jgi:uncharacterized RDD family membrane protein YckC
MEKQYTRNLLDPNELLELQYEAATSGKRLANYLIDIIAYILFIFTLAVVVGLVGLSETLADTDDNLVTLLYYAGYVLYYALFEVSIGKTPGKLITKTRVIDEEGGPISIGQAFGRSLARLIPFEVFSFLGPNRPRGWHDRLAGTWVVDDLPIGPNTYLQPTDPGPETE